MSKNTIQEFRELFRYWTGKLGLKYIPIIKDNRYDCYACIVEFEDGEVYLKYNTNQLKKWNRPLLICGIFHEIGHLIHPSKYETDEEIILAEYRAERFALDMMKGYYPKEYKETIKISRKNVRDSRYHIKDKLFYEAMKQIEEYK